MTHEIDFDAALARHLEARLATFVPVAQVGARAPRSSGARLAATAVAATLAMGTLGLGSEINAAADSQGLSCLDAFQKVKIFATSIAGQLSGATIEDQRAAKQRVNEYANGLISSSCVDETKTDLERLRGTPIPFPNGGGAGAEPAQQGAPKPADRGTPQPASGQ